MSRRDGRGSREHDRRGDAEHADDGTGEGRPGGKRALVATSVDRHLHAGGGGRPQTRRREQLGEGACRTRRLQRVECIARRPHRAEERDKADEHHEYEHAEAEHDPVGVHAGVRIGAPRDAEREQRRECDRAHDGENRAAEREHDGARTDRGHAVPAREPDRRERRLVSADLGYLPGEHDRDRHHACQRGDPGDEPQRDRDHVDRGGRPSVLRVRVGRREERARPEVLARDCEDTVATGGTVAARIRNTAVNNPIWSAYLRSNAGVSSTTPPEADRSLRSNGRRVMPTTWRCSRGPRGLRASTDGSPLPLIAASCAGVSDAASR